MAFLVPSTQGHLSFPFLSSFLPPFHLSSPSFSASFCYKISTGWTTTIVPLFRDTPCSCQGLTWEEQLTIKETISLLAIFLTIISHFYGHSNFRGEEVLHTSIYNEKKYIYILHWPCSSTSVGGVWNITAACGKVQFSQSRLSHGKCILLTISFHFLSWVRRSLMWHLSKEKTEQNNLSRKEHHKAHN